MSSALDAMATQYRTHMTLVLYDRKHPKAVVADFGCGDARLAESVKNKVHSFDLVSRKPIVTACNIANVRILLQRFWYLLIWIECLTSCISFAGSATGQLD
jgi:hypothetical protein